MSLHWHIIITQSLYKVYITLGVVHSVDVNKHTMAFVYYYGIIQNSFTKFSKGNQKYIRTPSLVTLSLTNNPRSRKGRPGNGQLWMDCYTDCVQRSVDYMLGLLQTSSILVFWIVLYFKVFGICPNAKSLDCSHRDI